jgi:hypothetical protein
MDSRTRRTRRLSIWNGLCRWSDCHASRQRSYGGSRSGLRNSDWCADCLSGKRCAATASFLIARYFARDWVERKLRAYPKFAAIDRAVEKQGFKIVLLTRLQPVLPFVLLNYGLGLTRVRLRDYVIASWIGMMPATILYVYLGSALHNVSDLFSGGAAKHSPAGLALFWGGLAAGALLLWLLTRTAKRALQQEFNQPAEGEVQHECHSAG